MKSGGPGDLWVPLDRVVAVNAKLPNGRVKWGSGFLLTATRVLTAWHCTVDDPQSGQLLPLTVRRPTAREHEFADATRVAEAHTIGQGGYEYGLDVAILDVADPPWGDQDWECPPFARVSREGIGTITGCDAVGFPMYMVDSNLRLDTAQISGTIRQGDGVLGGYLTLRDDRHFAPSVPLYVDKSQTGRQSSWGGLSGAVVFHKGKVLGHLVQHRPHLGDSTLTVVPIEAIFKEDSQNALDVARELNALRIEDWPVVPPTKVIPLWESPVPPQSDLGEIPPLDPHSLQIVCMGRNRSPRLVGDDLSLGHGGRPDPSIIVASDLSVLARVDGHALHIARLNRVNGTVRQWSTPVDVSQLDDGTLLAVSRCGRLGVSLVWTGAYGTNVYVVNGPGEAIAYTCRVSRVRVKAAVLHQGRVLLAGASEQGNDHNGCEAFPNLSVSTIGAGSNAGRLLVIASGMDEHGKAGTWIESDGRTCSRVLDAEALIRIDLGSSSAPKVVNEEGVAVKLSEPIGTWTSFAHWHSVYSQTPVLTIV